MIIFDSPWNWELRSCENLAKCVDCSKKAMVVSTYMKDLEKRFSRNYCFSCFVNTVRDWIKATRYKEDKEIYEQILISMKEYIRNHPELALEEGI